MPEGEPIYVTVDTSPTGIGWVINQEDMEKNRYAIRFGAKVLSDRQRKYSQVKRELWGIVSAVKADRDYLIGTEVIIETDCLPILGMISGCATPDIAMLRWIAYIKSLNPEIRHVAGKHNVVADMLSRARYGNEEESRSDEEDNGLDFFTASCAQILTTFKEEDYKGEFIEIGKYLSSLKKDESWTNEDFRCIWKKAYKYFLKDGYLWKDPKKRK